MGRVKALLAHMKPFPGHVKRSLDAMEVMTVRVKAITPRVETIMPRMKTTTPHERAFAERMKAFLAGKVVSLTRGNVFPEVMQGLCAGETSSTPGCIAFMRADQSFTLPIQTFTSPILTFMHAILSSTRPNHAFIRAAEPFTRPIHDLSHSDSTTTFFLGAYLGVLGVLAAPSMNHEVSDRP